MAETVMDALNKALGTPTEPAAEPPETEEVETGETEEETPSIEETDETEEVTEETEETDEPEEDADPDADEEDLEHGEDKGIEETPEAKATREAAEKAAARTPPDHVNDPVDPSLNKRTQERITTLANEVKDLRPRAQQGDELMGYIAQSGMNGDEFSQALTYGKLLHSDDIEDNRKALAFVWKEAQSLAAKLGESLPGTNPMDGHADLAARVAAKTLTQEDALELARGRNREKATKEATQRVATSRTTQAQQSRATEEAEARVKEDFNELGAHLMATDPQFEARMAALKKDPTEPLKRIANTPPALRVNAFFKAFRSVKIAPKAAKPAAKPGQQPLRANKSPASGSGVRREPKTAIEALDFALTGR